MLGLRESWQRRAAIGLLALAFLVFPARLHGQVITEAAHLHTLLDPATFLPSDTTTLFTVEGIVTTHVSLTDAPSTLFYIQDATAGIAVFHQNGAASYSPKAGDRVRVTAPLTHFNGLLELQPRAANAEHSVTLLEPGNDLPEPAEFDFSWRKDPNVMEPQESRYVVLRDVMLDASSPIFKLGGENVTITNQTTRETAIVRIDPHTDIPSQGRPASPVTIYGVVTQFDSSNPRTSGYQILPTRFEDIVAEMKAATVRFTNVLETALRTGDVRTNSFEEHSLLPGETLRIEVRIDDPEGREVRVNYDPGSLPDHASWNFEQETGQAIRGVFQFTPSSEQAGRLFAIRLLAANPVTTNDTVWTVYVPNAAEQAVVMTEIMANPTSNAGAAHYNPLRRAEPAPNPASHDEYVELVNFSSNAVELLNWTISDEVQVRHRFEKPFSLGPFGSVVVYGGPWTNHAPGLQTPHLATSVAQLFGLNNSGGDTLSLRNAQGRLVWRVHYSTLPSDGSLTRSSAAAEFVPHASVSALPVSPGLQSDGEPFGAAPDPEPEPEPSPAVRVSILRTDSGVRLRWDSLTGRSYTVLRYGASNAPPVETMVTATGASSEFEEPAGEPMALFIVRSN